MSKKTKVNLPALLQNNEVTISSSVNLNLSRNELIDLTISDLESELEDQAEKDKQALAQFDIDNPVDPRTLAYEANPKLKTLVEVIEKASGLVLSFSLHYNESVTIHNLEDRLFSFRSNIDIRKTDSFIQRMRLRKPIEDRFEKSIADLNKFRSTNKKLKNEITRKFLNASEEGKNIVANLDAIRAQFKEKLLEVKK